MIARLARTAKRTARPAKIKKDQWAKLKEAKCRRSLKTRCD